MSVIGRWGGGGGATTTTDGGGGSEPIKIPYQAITTTGSDASFKEFFVTEPTYIESIEIIPTNTNGSAEHDFTIPVLVFGFKIDTTDFFSVFYNSGADRVFSISRMFGFPFLATNRIYFNYRRLDGIPNGMMAVLRGYTLG